MYDSESEKDKRLREAPYRKVQAAENLVNSNALLDYYVLEYKKKFRNQPILPVDNSHLTTAKDIAKATGNRAYAIVEHYFTMDPDGWYSKNGYTIEFLKRNLAAVNTSLSKLTPRHNKSDTINVHTFCDCCWKDMIRVVRFDHNYDDPNRCENCIASGTPLKRVTKKERQQTVLKLGAVFPDLPRVATEEKKQEQLKNLVDFEKEKP